MGIKTSDDDGEALLDAKTMDGPTMRWAPSDIFRGNPRAFLTYHVMSAGYDYMSPVGVTLGGLIGVSPLRKTMFPRMTALQVAGSVGFVAGLVGMASGFGAMYLMSKAKIPTKMPFDDEGIQTRVDGLSHNFMVRVMDVGVVAGAASATGLMVTLGPTSLGLSVGALGVAQGLSLGSAAGSVASLACISSVKDKLPGKAEDF